MIIYLFFFMCVFFVLRLFDSVYQSLEKRREQDADVKINYEVFLNETFVVDSAVVIFQACLILVLFPVERRWTWDVKSEKYLYLVVKIA